jgi:hypothetical protein
MKDVVLTQLSGPQLARAGPARGGVQYLPLQLPHCGDLRGTEIDPNFLDPNPGIEPQTNADTDTDIGATGNDTDADVRSGSAARVPRGGHAGGEGPRPARSRQRK